MKVLAVLCLLGLVAAEPQLILPYSSPLLTPTIKADGGVISTYTATYPYAGIPLVKAALPGTPLLKSGLPSTPLVQTGLPLIHGYHPFSIPTVVAAKPAEVTAARQKRSADPEPAINFPSTLGTISTPAATIPATLATIPTTLNYNYAGLPAAISPYTIPQTIPYAGAAGVTPFVGTWPFTTGLSPYTTHMPYLYPVVSSAKIETPKGEAVSRAKRSADPEADPQLLTTNTGVTGFAYPAVNTGTFAPTTYTYQNLPITYPTTYTAAFPSFRTLPVNTVFG
ncbi:uncharacterized protein LOC135218520 [Macrobrachium nipponense]|uniref:uncharacterized protein LOC135218520 n=1 Tax=Macrobrachium nipponense TaxID=159736 RepID=UPI0030C88361